MRALRLSPLRPYVCSSCRTRGTVEIVNRRLASTSSSEDAKPDIYDVVCVGGGPVGLALLAALRASPTTSRLRIALIESQDLSSSQSWNPPADEYSNRASSLTPSSLAFLQDIGAWPHFDHTRVQPYNEMKVGDGSSNTNITFNWSIDDAIPSADAVALDQLPWTPVGNSVIATMAENSNIVRALLRRIEELDGQGGEARIFSQTMVSKIENGTDDPEGLDLSAWPVLQLQAKDPKVAAMGQPKSIAARLLIGADGINSPVRSFSGIETAGWDYDRHGIVASLEIEPSTLASANSTVTAYQRFLPALGGPIALLPFPENKASLVWSTTPQNAAYLKTLSPESFIAMVNAAFHLSMTDISYMLSLPADAESTISQHTEELNWRLQHTPRLAHAPPLIASIQPRTLASFPLRYRHTSSYISPRIALTGDAAHTIHPLAGQGLNLGLGDAKSLADTLSYAVAHGMDVGDLLSLERYASERYSVNAKVGGVCDVLHWVYGVESGPVAWARGIGAGIMERLPWVKGLLMQQAAGK